MDVLNQCMASRTIEWNLCAAFPYEAIIFMCSGGKAKRMTTFQTLSFYCTYVS